MPVESTQISVDVLKKDFDRYANMHSWYKGLSLDGAWFDMTINHGCQSKWSPPDILEDIDNLHWHFMGAYNDDGSIYHRNPYKVKLNFCLISTA